MRNFAFSVALGLGVLIGFQVSAQDFALSISSATAEPGEMVTISNFFDNNSAATNLQGYGWGNCIADTAVTEIISVEEGPDSRGANGSGAPFYATTVLPGEGWTIGAITDFGGMLTIDPGVTGSELAIATYSILAEGVSAVDYCDTLGTPLVETSVADVNSQSFIPVQTGGVITGELPPPVVVNFEFTAGSGSAGYDPANGAATVSINLDILEDDTNMNFPNETSGFSMGLAHDGALIEATDIDLGPLDVALGAAAQFVGPMILANGITIGTIFDFSSVNAIEFDVAKTVATITYSAVGLAGNDTGATANLTWDDTLGTPLVENTVVVGTAPSPVDFVDGAITFSPVIEEPFIRGNCNDDGTVNIADGIYILNNLFQGGPDGPCAAACDANGDGSITMTDAMTVLFYRLMDGAPPAAPFPNCGIEVGADCAGSAVCP